MKVFEPNTRSFSNNGLGFINAIKCLEVKKKSLNGWYIEAEVAIDYQKSIVQDNIVFVETKEKGGQPFRINNINVTDRKIAFTANHVVFDCERYLLDDVRPTNLNAPAYLTYLNSRTDTKSPFFVNSDITSSATNYFVRKTLLEAFQQAEEAFGGTYDIDMFTLNLKNSIGNDNGTTVIYGKNAQSVNIVEDWSSVCTKLLPEGPDGLLLPEKYLVSDIQYDNPFTRTIAFTIEKEDINGNEKTANQILSELREVGVAYIKQNKFPKINYTIKADPDNNLCIGDIIHVKHPLTTIDAEVQAYTYDTISRRVKTLEFGNYTRDVKKVFDGIKQKTEDALHKSNINEWMIKEQTNMIINQHKNGFVYIDENEIFILDKLPKEKAKNVWRWNMGGLGFSKNGFNGPFELAITQDGKINASFILAGIIQGISIVGNTISNGLNFHVDADGNLQCMNAKISGYISGSSISASSIESKNASRTKEVKIDGGSINLYEVTTEGDVQKKILALSLGNNQINFYDWEDKGNFAGAIGPVRSNGRTGVAFWSDIGDQLYIGCKNANGKIDTAFAIDANTIGSHTPYICNTASGTLNINGGIVEIENGLIKTWDFPSTISGYFYAQDGTKITYERGLITKVG